MYLYLLMGPCHTTPMTCYHISNKNSTETMGLYPNGYTLPVVDASHLWGGKRRHMTTEELCSEALSHTCTDKNHSVDDIPVVAVHNIVSTSLMKGGPIPIDLQQISLYLPCSNYNRRKFAAITIRIDHPKCTALLFSSGKLVVTGVKTWYECLLASLCVRRIIQSTIFEATFRISNCVIQNIVAHSEIDMKPGQKLDIQRMYENMAMQCTYQRNMFPGLIYRNEESTVVLLCFFSGKIVLTGGKNIADVLSAWNKSWLKLQTFIR
jgi:transcription initiation factor TFIID TATA-box-binding protein